MARSISVWPNSAVSCSYRFLIVSSAAPGVVRPSWRLACSEVAAAFAFSSKAVTAALRAGKSDGWSSRRAICQDYKALGFKNQ